VRSFTQDIADQRREQLVVHEANKILKSEWKATTLERVPNLFASDKLNDEVNPDEATMKFKILPFNSQLEKDVAAQVRINLSETTSRLDSAIRPAGIEEEMLDWNKQAMILFVPINLNMEWAVSPEIQL